MEPLEKVKEAAVRAAEGYSQKEIAEALGVSQSQVSRMLDEASQRRWLRTKPVLLGSLAAESHEIRNRIYGGRLPEKLAMYCDAKDLQVVPKVHVHFSRGELPSDENPSTRDNWDNALRNWASNGAGRTVFNLLVRNVSQINKQGLVIGIAWGRHCRSCLDAMRDEELTREANESGTDLLTVIPLWPPRLVVSPEKPEKEFPDHRQLSSNSLAADLYEILNGVSHRWRSAEFQLPGVDFIGFSPGDHFDVVPETDEERVAHAREEEKVMAIIRQAFAVAPAYRNLFVQARSRGRKPGPPLIERLGATVMSVGSSGSIRSFAVSKNYGGIPQDWVSEHTLGDIGGAPCEKQDLSKHVEFQMDRVKRRWCGPTINQIKDAAKMAIERGTPGNIALATGAREDILLHGIDLEAFNHLVIDHFVAQRLEQQIDERLSRFSPDRSRPPNVR